MSGFREFVKYNLPILLVASRPRCGKFFSEFILYPALKSLVVTTAMPTF